MSEPRTEAGRLTAGKVCWALHALTLDHNPDCIVIREGIAGIEHEAQKLGDVERVMLFEAGEREAATSPERTIYAVVYGNYEPPEVAALYADELSAVEDAEARNLAAQTGMWKVRPMSLAEQSEQSE